MTFNQMREKFKKGNEVITKFPLSSTTARFYDDCDIPKGSFGKIHAIHINELFEKITFVVQFENGKMGHLNHGLELATPLDRELA